MKERVKLRCKTIKIPEKFKFGDKIENLWASDKNPHRIGYFVRYLNKQHKNKYGVTHTYHEIEMTDGKGNFWKLNYDKDSKLRLL